MRPTRRRCLQLLSCALIAPALAQGGCGIRYRVHAYAPPPPPPPRVVAVRACPPPPVPVYLACRPRCGCPRCR